jgi:hypothetical protein
MANVRGGACRQRGDAIGAEPVAAFRREEPPGAGSRDVCLSGNAGTDDYFLLDQDYGEFGSRDCAFALFTTLLEGGKVALITRSVID